MAGREETLSKPRKPQSASGLFQDGPLAKALPPLAVAACVIALGLAWVSKPAWVFDETYYFELATGVRQWFAAPGFAETDLEKVLYQGNYHPPLPLYFMAMTQALFQSDVQDFLFAVRIASVLQFALLAVAVYLFMKREAGLTAALFAVVLTVFSPQLFANSLLATYDVPTALFWVLTTFAFYRGMTSRGWAIASGVIFGLALLTKINSFFLPLALWPWGLYFHRKKSIPAIVSMLLAGPVVFYAGWPWLWAHPLSNFARYVCDKVQPGGLAASFFGVAGSSWREAIPTLYFGSAAPSGVPWHYALVMTAITSPLAAIAGCAATAPRSARKTTGGLVALLWWSIFAQIAVFTFLMKPYDGVRLFLPVLPLVSILGGLGLAALAQRGKVLAAVAAALTLASPCAEFIVYQPFGMSYFSPIVGGLPGAARLGMEVTYYGEAVTPAQLAAINSRARQGQRVAYGPMFKNLPWRMPDEYIRYGFLKLGLVPAATTDDWDFLIFINRGGSTTEADGRLLAEGEVIAENRLLGVTLSRVLQRRRVQLMEGDNAPRQR